MVDAERDVRVEILNSFLTAPHRKIADLAPFHLAALERDPLFYAHLALWYFENGEVRDHKTLFVAHLLTSEYPEFREVGWVLLQELAPFEIARVVDHCKQVIGKAPRVLKSAIRHYLQTREANPRQFDGAALRARRALKHLYASLRLRPSDRAQAILFANQPPPESGPALLKRLAKAETAEEQARIILDGPIPYVTAIGAVKQVTPALVVALIEAMSPQEVINSLAALKRRGALSNPEVKALVEQKLAAAREDRRVSTLKAKKAIEVAGLDSETERTLTRVTDQRVAAKVEITRATALFVDKSASMTQAIEVAKQLAALISAVVRAEFSVYAFDTAAFKIKPGHSPGLIARLGELAARIASDAPGSGGADAGGRSAAPRPALSAWEEAFRFVKANGNTSIGAPLAKLRQEKIRVEQIVLVTDECENTAPFFHDAYAAYAAELGVRPRVAIVHVGSKNPSFMHGLTQRGIEVTRYEFTGDYYSLPNILPLLAMPSRAELVDLIMQREFPRRPAPGAR